MSIYNPFRTLFTLLSSCVLFFKLVPHKLEISSSMQMFVVFLIDIFSSIKSKIWFYNESWPSHLCQKRPLWTINLKTSTKIIPEKTSEMNFQKTFTFVRKFPSEKIQFCQTETFVERSWNVIYFKKKSPSNPSLVKKRKFVKSVKVNVFPCVE